jgi:hypothetical protein
MSDIPRARELIEDGLKHLDPKHPAFPYINHATKLLKRQSPASRAPIASEPMTPHLARRIRQHKQRHPMLTQHEIAIAFNVNPGRVSEALNFKI